MTSLLKQVDIDPKDNPAVVCGPPVMMKFGTRDLLKIGYKEENLYLSMEKKMYCGFWAVQALSYGRVLRLQGRPCIHLQPD